MAGLKLYNRGELLGVVSFDEDKKIMHFTTEAVKRIIESLRQSHFSSLTPDEEIFDQLPLLLRGQYYCEGLDED